MIWLAGVLLVVALGLLWVALHKPPPPRQIDPFDVFRSRRY